MKQILHKKKKTKHRAIDDFIELHLLITLMYRVNKKNFIFTILARAQDLYYL